MTGWTRVLLPVKAANTDCVPVVCVMPCLGLFSSPRIEDQRWWHEGSPCLLPSRRALESTVQSSLSRHLS